MHLERIRSSKDKMEFKDNTYRAIELLRFLRKGDQEHTWTSFELAIAIAVDDESITSRLVPLYCFDESDEDDAKIHNTIKEIIRERRKRKLPIPAFDAVKDTLNELVRHGWVKSKSGSGYWLLSEGRNVLLLEILHAFGEDVGTARCCGERNKFQCAYCTVCRAHRFHKELSSLLVEIMEGVTIEDIALGTWQSKHKFKTNEDFKGKRRIETTMSRIRDFKNDDPDVQRISKEYS